MRTNSRPIRILAAAALLVLAGCFKLSRATPPLRQYVLSGASQTSAVAGAGAGAVPNAGAGTATNATARTASAQARAGLTIGLRRLNLAAYLAVPAIVTRRGENQIVTSE